MNAKPQIFISYAREDEKKVLELYQKLSVEGFKPWMDKKDIRPGEKWEYSIQTAIRHSDFFVVCLSANSVDKIGKRGNLQEEYIEALSTFDIRKKKLACDIYLIPARLENCKVPESLLDFQYVDLFEANGWTTLVQTIQEEIQRRTKGQFSVQETISSSDNRPAGFPQTYDGPKSKTKVELTFSIKLEQFSVQYQTLLQNALVNFLGISPQDIRIIKVEKGSVKITVELPTQSAERLLSAYKSNDSKLVTSLAPLVLLNLRVMSVERKAAAERETKGHKWTPHFLLMPEIRTAVQSISKRILAEIDPTGVKVSTGFIEPLIDMTIDGELAAFDDSNIEGGFGGADLMTILVVPAVAAVLENLLNKPVENSIEQLKKRLRHEQQPEVFIKINIGDIEATVSSHLPSGGKKKTKKLAKAIYNALLEYWEN